MVEACWISFCWISFKTYPIINYFALGRRISFFLDKFFLSRAVEGVEGGGDQNMVCGAIEKRVWGEVEGVEEVEGDGDQNMVCGA